MIRKSKFDGKFVRQRLKEMTIKENIAVYDVLKDKGDDVDDKALFRIRRAIDKDTKSSMKEADKQAVRYEKVQFKLQRLKRAQVRRRRRLLNWFKKYVAQMEAKETQQLIDKFERDINIPGLTEIILEKYSDEELMFVVEEETEEFEEENQAAEKAEDESIGIEDLEDYIEELEESDEGDAIDEYGDDTGSEIEDEESSEEDGKEQEPEESARAKMKLLCQQ